MYEAEYHFALPNAGFDGFLLLLFHFTDGIKGASGDCCPKTMFDLRIGIQNVLHLGVVINELVLQIRPFEPVPSATCTDLYGFARSLDDLCAYVDEHPESKCTRDKVPHPEGAVGTVAQLAWHICELISGNRFCRRRLRVSLAQTTQGAR